MSESEKVVAEMGKDQEGAVKEVEDKSLEEPASPEGGDNEVDPYSLREFDFGMAKMPPEVQRRVKALKKIQMAVTQTESQFYKEMHDLEAKYAPLYTKFFEKRKEIISGAYEPTTEECDFCVGNDAETDAMIDSLNKLKLEAQQKEGKEPEPVVGIPDFWPTIFKNVDLLAEMVHEQDTPVLKHLTDIKFEVTSNPMGFKLFFHFSDNEYFPHPVLTKTYEMKCEVDSQDPFSFEGPEIVKCTGFPIEWKEGKNVTVRVVRKKQKHKQQGTIRMVSKTEAVSSFFDFFNPPQVEDESEPDEDTQMRLTTDFEIGQYIRERIIPRAVLYFTGEALDEDFDDEEEEDEDDTDSEDDDDDDSASPVRRNGQDAANNAGDGATTPGN